MNSKLLSLLVCPVCKMALEYQKHHDELLCHHCQLAYPVRDDIPVLLQMDARSLRAQVTANNDSGTSNPDSDT